MLFGVGLRERGGNDGCRLGTGPIAEDATEVRGCEGAEDG